MSNMQLLTMSKMPLKPLLNLNQSVPPSNSTTFKCKL